GLGQRGEVGLSLGGVVEVRERPRAADVVEAGAALALDPPRVKRLRLRVELGQRGRLAPQLAVGLARDVVLEEAKRDRSGDESRQEDPREEERRETEPKAAEHRASRRSPRPAP